MKIANKDLDCTYFVQKHSGERKCRCGQTRKQGKDWANLLDHITRDHADTINEARYSENTVISSFFRKRDDSVFKWIRWVAQDWLPFAFCENNNTREFTKLEPITVKTLKVHMNKLTQLIETKIRSILPQQFAIVI